MVATGVSPRPWMSYGSSALGVAIPVVLASSSDWSSSLSSSSKASSSAAASVGVRNNNKKKESTRVREVCSNCQIFFG